MCAIIGFSGKKTQFTNTILKTLHSVSSERGTDASGLMLFDKRKGTAVYKDGISSVILSNNKEYKSLLSEYNYNGLIAHCRRSTHGTERNNINNHPHCTKNLRYNLVHNGVVVYYDNDIKCASQCDSEIMLRLIEKYGIKSGVKKIFNNVYGSFSCIVTDTYTQKLYFFTNGSSPLVYSINPMFGGLFLASTKELLNKAVNDSFLLLGSKIKDVEPYKLFSVQMGNTDIKLIERYTKPVKEMYESDFTWYSRYYTKSQETEKKSYTLNSALLDDYYNAYEYLDC